MLFDDCGGECFIMEIITIECPKCKGELHVKEGTEKFFCMYCRSEVVVKNPESEQTEVIVESVNHEFQARLAIAKHNEDLYKKNQLSYDQVMNSYDEVKLVGAHHWEYWHARADFFLRSGFRRVDISLRKAKQKSQSRYKVLASRKAFVDTYTMYMDNAIKYAVENKPMLEQEKQSKLKKIQKKLDDVKEHSPTSKEPFQPRPATDEEAAYNFMFWFATAIFILLFIITRIS